MKYSTVVLIGNPAAGRASLKKFEHAIQLIRASGHKVEFFLTHKSGDAGRFAKEVSGGSDLIISAGGDGTSNEIINGIASCDVPMAIIPMGSTNVLARELNVPMDIKKAVELALKGSAHRVPLGRITLGGNSRRFALMAGIGYDAEAVYSVSGRVKALIGNTSYVLSGLKNLLRWRPQELTVALDSSPFMAYSLIVCKSSHYAGRFILSPDADIAEPLLYAFLMHGRQRLDILRYAAGIITGTHLRLKDITYLPAKGISINGSAPVQADGEYIGRTPATIDVVPDALSLVY